MAPSSQPLRTLIVDDDASVRTLLRQTLARAGYEVSEARDGNEAIRVFKAAPAQLVITDILMPEKDGIEAIREFRRTNPGVKIIAISGGSGKCYFENLESVRRLTPVAILPKPFAKATLLSLIEKCVMEGAIEHDRARRS